MAESTHDEFLADFGDSLSEKDLDRLLAQSRASDDREVRVLVKQYRTLRDSCGALIAAIEAGSTAEELRKSPTLQFARFLVGAKPQSPS